MNDESSLLCANPTIENQLAQSEIMEAIRRVLVSGNYILGEQNRSFEANFAKYCGSKYAIGVANGTDALKVSLLALNVGAGDEVITSSHTALATVAAILDVGATPVLVDIEAEHYTLDPNKIEEMITKRTKVIIPVHLYGQVSAMDKILQLSKKYALSVIEDCAQAHGAIYHGKPVGTLGDLGCFSFYPTKNLGAIGDAGAIITNNDALAARIKKIQQYGWDKQRISNCTGINSRLDEIQAAILNVKLNRLEQSIFERIKLADYYNQHLLPPIVHPAKRFESRHVFHLYVIKTSHREALISALNEQNIKPGIHYTPLIHQQRGYQQYLKLPTKGLPVLESIAKEILSLPLYPGLSHAQQDRVISIINTYRNIRDKKTA